MKKFIGLLLGFLLVFFVAGSASANLIQNGDFEIGDSLIEWNAFNVTPSTGPGGNTIAKFNVPGGSGWATLSQEFYIPNPQTFSGIAIEFDVNFGGNPEVDLDWFKETVRLETTSGYAWAYQFKFQTYDPTSGMTHVMTGIPFDTFDPIVNTDPNAKIIFQLHENTGDYSWAHLDNIVVNPVPEPTTMLLLGSGLIGLAGLGRRKLRKR